MAKKPNSTSTLTPAAKTDDTEHDLNQRKHGKVKTGRIVDGQMVYDDEKPEPEEIFEIDEDIDEDADEEPAPKKKGTKREEAAKSMQKAIDKKAKGGEDQDAKVDGDTVTVTLKPSQRPAKPRHERQVIPPPPSSYKGKVITISDLESEFNLDGKKIRRIIRSEGFSAPSTNDSGFGARARYEWAEGDKTLKQIRKVLQEEVDS